MIPDQVKRKLAAILSADVQGYSRLMGEDEEGTIRTLKVYLEVISGFIAQHQGRVVGTGGDSILAEFGSVVDAVRCAVAIQKDLQDRNETVAEDRRLQFRMGVNLGDVVEEGDTILGDGVNIAARLEGLAEAGGICISGTAYDHVENKLPLGYEYFGEQAVKNIAKPVRVYRVVTDPEAVGRVIEKTGTRPWPKTTLGLIAAAIAIVAALAIWKFYLLPAPPPQVSSKENIKVASLEKPAETVPTPPVSSAAPALKEKATPPSPEKVAQPAPPPAPKMEVADKKKMAFPLPEEPSIAVLPFVNMSEDPKQEFLSDGITEEIITALSKVRHLFVISRQSTFSYKGKPVKVKQVSEELGVRYVLEGSVQRSADRIRINAQLIDALTGRHIWAERYNRNLTDIFDLQDDITTKILTAIRVKLTEGEQAISAEKYFKGKQGLDCYLKVLEGVKYYLGHNIEDTKRARQIAEEAIEMCPEVPSVYILLGHVNQMEYWLGLGKSPRESIEKGVELTQKALAMDDSSPSAHGLLSMLYTMKREYDKAISEGERAVALAPAGANAHMHYGMSLHYGGRPEEAIPVLQKAIRLNPLGETGNFLNLGHAYRAMGRFEEAVSAYKKSLQRSPDSLFAHLGLAATNSMMGREQEARAEAAEVLRISPKFSVDSYAKRLTFKDQTVTDKFIDALRKAGLK